MSKILYIVTALLELVTALMQKYQTSQMEKKYEEATNHTSDVWSSGFGVRKTDKDAPSQTTTNE